MTEKQKLSIVINTKNAAATLKETLKSVKEIADEIIVVDMHSSDETREIAKKYQAKIFLHKDLSFADPARNFALSKASHDWILVLDADEEIPAALKATIQKIINDPQSAKAYYLPRKNIIWGKWIQHTGWWPDHQLRLFKKGEVKWPGKVHQLAEAKSKAEYLAAEEQFALLHHNYQTVSDFIERLNRYTTLEVDKITQENKKALSVNSVIKIFKDEWLKRLFALEGYKDGTHGLSLSFLQASYELVALLKINEKNLQENKPQNDEIKTMMALKNFQKDLSYWIADYYVKNSKGFKKIYWQMRKKFSSASFVPAEFFSKIQGPK